MSSDDLQELPGVGPATAEKLKDNGFDSYQSIAVADSAELSNKADVGDSTANDAIQAAREVADIGGFESGKDVLDRRERIGKLSFFIDDLDELFGGGVETQSITEFYGEFGAGKSQFTHQLCVNVQVPSEKGGLDGRAIFVDTEDSFRPERIREMVGGLDDDILEACMDRDGIDGSPDNEDDVDALTEIFLERIHVAKAFNSDHQVLLAEKAMEIGAEFEDSDFPVRVCCIDSIMSHFRSEYPGRGQLAKRQQKLNKHIHDLKRMSDLHNCAVILANQVSANPDAFFGDPTTPVGGNVLGHASTFRIYLRKSKENKRVVKMVDAPNLPDGEAVCRIEGDGVRPE